VATIAGCTVYRVEVRIVKRYRFTNPDVHRNGASHLSAKALTILRAKHCTRSGEASVVIRIELVAAAAVKGGVCVRIAVLYVHFNVAESMAHALEIAAKLAVR
jgi:hypothetical protein